MIFRWKLVNILDGSILSPRVGMYSEIEFFAINSIWEYSNHFYLK
jgi:hypothetical protein